ncbi:hypothetical protein L227DRAFT_405438 [Lentinus tigrinus ALCF2SS1-6]|uniref:Uncharacterized protein n=1 Tax=Lentinus tigrinus ALCF2SS1-6 TaxID=1328759 RepID=A0A5C2RPF4_9APHY|nr:hypothetical protein L227DRAFT_405438 [Lentinus tigrinus ALCF2SS1-6]
MSSYGLDLSPAQAPLNCFGSGIISRDGLSSRILARLRPRHHRKTLYNERLRNGDAHMNEAQDVFQSCQRSLSHEKRRSIQGHLDGLRIERDRLGKFSDFAGSQGAEMDGLSRAETFRTNASRVRAMAAQARKNAQHSPASHHSRAPSASVQSHRGTNTGSRRTSSENHHRSATRTHTSLSRPSTRNDEPLQMIQTRAGPVSWSPNASCNALQLDLGYRASPRPPTMMSTGTPRTPNSMLSLEMPLAQFSPVRMSPVSGYGGSPTDSLAYSLGSDGFPRPSRRAPDRRSTIQTTTNLSRSSASRRSTQQSGTGTHSSLARQSMESSRHRSGSGSYNSHSHRPASHDGHGPRTYTRTPTSLQTSSVPPAYSSLPGTPRY